MAVLEAMRQPTAVSALKMLSSRSQQPATLTCTVRTVPVVSSAKRHYVSITKTRVQAADVPTMADVPRSASTGEVKGLRPYKKSQSLQEAEKPYALDND